MHRKTANPSEKADDSSEVSPRSLDTFLETAYKSGTGIPWQYWCTMLSLGVANSSDASEILCLSYILSNSDFEEGMLDDSSWKAGLLAASVFLGMLLGGLFIGTLGDFLGRKSMLMTGLICNAVAGILSALSQNVLTLSLLRAIAGLGIGATVPPLFTLVTELAPPSRRGFFVTVAASFWMVGSIYVALTALAILAGMGLSWRIFMVACALPSAMGAVLVGLLVPESPRFLALQGYSEEAVRTANHVALQLHYTGPLLTVPEVQAHFPRRTHAVVHSHSIRIALKEAFQDWKQNASQLYSPSLLRTTCPLQMVWFSLSFGSYGILTWINTLFVAVHLDNVYFSSLLFAMANLPGNILSAVFMDWTGRSKMLVCTSLAAALSLLTFAYFAWDDQSSKVNTTGIVVSACSFQALSIAAWNTIDCMTSELFPTSVRSTGMGVCAASGRIGAMVAQFVNGTLVDKPVRLLVVASFTLILGAMTPYLLPNGDMAQRPLQDGLEQDDTTTDNEEPLPFLNEAPYKRVEGGDNSYKSIEGGDEGIALS